MAATKTTRRKFLKQSALIAGAPMIIPSSVLGRNGKVTPSNQVVVGVVIEAEGRGCCVDAFCDSIRDEAPQVVVVEVGVRQLPAPCEMGQLGIGQVQSPGNSGEILA